VDCTGERSCGNFAWLWYTPKRWPIRQLRGKLGLFRDFSGEALNDLPLQTSAALFAIVRLRASDLFRISFFGFRISRPSVSLNCAA
jgi:hypothetical protein